MSIDKVNIKDFNIPVFGRTIVTNLLPQGKGYVSYESFTQSFNSPLCFQC